MNPADVDGTGRRGAVTKEDIVNFARNGGAGKAGGARPEERVPMTRIRKRIAERLMESKNSTAMLTTFNEVDLSRFRPRARNCRTSSSRPTASSWAS